MMQKALRIVLGFASGFLLVAGVGGVGDLRLKETSDQAYFRVVFRFRPPLISHCRKLSLQEQEKLPVHMRQQEICERSFLPYRLRVSLGGRVVLEKPLVARGIHHDRPIGVDELFPLPPGTYPVEVLLFPQEEEKDGITLEYRQELVLQPRTVVLLTLEEDRRWVRKGGREAQGERKKSNP